MKSFRILILLLTSFSLNVSFPSFPERNHSSEKSSENCPSKNSYGINSNHPRDKCIFATSQKSYNVRAHMICIFFPEILHEKSTSVIFENIIKPRRQLVTSLNGSGWIRTIEVISVLGSQLDQIPSIKFYPTLKLLDSILLST